MSRNFGRAACAEAASVTPPSVLRRLANAVCNLFADVDPADHEILRDGRALLSNLLGRFGEEIDQQRSYRYDGDEPVEPVVRSGGRGACALACVPCSTSRCCTSCASCLGACGSGRPCRTAKRVKSDPCRLAASRNLQAAQRQYCPSDWQRGWPHCSRPDLECLAVGRLCP